MILDLKNSMASVTIFRDSLPLYVTAKSITDKSDRLKAVVLTLNRDEYKNTETCAKHEASNNLDCSIGGISCKER